MSDRTRLGRFGKRRGKREEMEKGEERQEANAVACMHTTSLLTMPPWRGLNEEREEDSDRQVKSVKRKHVE